MAHRLKKREDGYYQRQVIVGRNPDGSYIRKSVYGQTIKELEQKVAEIKQKIQEGTKVLDDRTTFGRLAEIWLEECNPTQTEKWHMRQRTVINKHLLPALGYMKVTELKPYHLQMVINAEAKNGLATGTMKQIKQTAVRILDVALQAETIQRNVFQSIKVPSIPPKERQALTDYQIRIVNETWETHFMGYSAMIMLYCGLRRGELCALKWSDIDLNRKTISVNKAIEILTNQSSLKEPKSKAGIRTVPIPEALYNVLLQVKGPDDDLVCPSRHGELMSEKAWNSAWKSYMNHLNLYCGGKNASRSNPKQVAFPAFTAHMLRHTYATMLYDAGVDIKSAQYFLGHADIEMTLSVYTHLTPHKVDEAIGSFNKHLEETVTIVASGGYCEE